jgi:hypothetical protein
MRYQVSYVPRSAAALVLKLFIFTTSATAGPPLICHTIDIGGAKSLPWISHNWNLTGSESYDTRNLVSDTISILDSDPTVLVHLETLRRATLYSQNDFGTSRQLLLKLVARSNAAGNAADAALASFDAGYFAETMKQLQWIHKGSANPAQGFDGFSLIKKAVQFRGDDPQMAFAAALITLDGPASEHQEYARKALAGAKSDSLLARNLSTHFMSSQSETMAEMISRTPSTKVAKQ